MCVGKRWRERERKREREREKDRKRENESKSLRICLCQEYRHWRVFSAVVFVVDVDVLVVLVMNCIGLSAVKGMPRTSSKRRNGRQSGKKEIITKQPFCGVDLGLAMNPGIAEMFRQCS